MDYIYYNGNIITMEKQDEQFSAMLVCGDRIVMLGDDEAVLRRKTASTECVDLKGKTVMPGFIDAHGHFMVAVMSGNVFVDVACAPTGTISSMNDLIQTMRTADEAQPGKQMLVGFGFDDTLIEEYRMPDAKDLDQVSTERGVVVLHPSLHMMSANTKAMEMAGVTAPDFNPDGATIYRDEEGNPTGVFEEMGAMAPFLKKMLGPKILAQLPGAIGKTCKHYMEKGVTTVCEGNGVNVLASLAVTAEKVGKFPVRYIMCPAMGKKVPKKMERKDPLKYIDGPVKLIQDGSIQIYTAGLTKPYAVQHASRAKADDYSGFQIRDAESLKKLFEEIIAAGRTFAIHANGDGTIDTIIEALSGCRNLSQIQPRNLLIHSQTIREDQLDKLTELHLYPSFFPAHIHVWGDRHKSTFLGEERANRINPCGSALKRSIPFSLHNDPPVTKVNPLSSVWSAVTRQTSSGEILGAEQCIPVYDALKAVTIDAAWQYGLDDMLGSLAPGKKADFILLDSNPLTCEADKLPQIQVEKVWIDGKTVWNV
ncbi:MAG: amidohydrolase family protein [Peptococcaceae bacterium]|nr:amidohydrolase family protein [Peptococcaceae bacterium]